MLENAGESPRSQAEPAGRSGRYAPARSGTARPEVSGNEVLRAYEDHVPGHAAPPVERHPEALRHRGEDQEDVEQRPRKQESEDETGGAPVEALAALREHWPDWLRVLQDGPHVRCSPHTRSVGGLRLLPRLGTHRSIRALLQLAVAAEAAAGSGRVGFVAPAAVGGVASSSSGMWSRWGRSSLAGEDSKSRFRLYFAVCWRRHQATVQPMPHSASSAATRSAPGTGTAAANPASTERRNAAGDREGPPRGFWRCWNISRVQCFHGEAVSIRSLPVAS